mgnify:CR=1 FL=1
MAHDSMRFASFSFLLVGPSSLFPPPFPDVKFYG